MDTTKLITRETFLNAKADAVWDALTNPEKTSQFMFNCRAYSDWKAGSPIRWEGNYQGYQSGERGQIVEATKGTLLSYTSFDPNFGLEDTPENYLVITYKLSEVKDGTVLTTTIQNFNNDPERMKHIAAGWDGVVLPGLRNLF